MSILQKIRLGAAIVLLCAICLPLSQCAQGLSTETPQAFAHARHFFPRSDNEFQYHYAITEIDFGLMGALTLVAFCWPLAFAIWSRRARLRRFWWIFYALELLLCAGTAYWVYVLTQSGRWLYGAYIAEIAIAIYAITTLVPIGNRLRNLFRNRRFRP
jgi:hypothetical protein